MYCCNVNCCPGNDRASESRRTNKPTVTPAAMEGTDPVRAYPVMPPPAVSAPRTRAMFPADLNETWSVTRGSEMGRQLGLVRMALTDHGVVAAVGCGADTVLTAM